VADAPEVASGSSARSKACDSRDSRTLRSSTRDVRIFKKNTFGCHVGRGRAFALGDYDIGDGGLYNIRVAGSDPDS